MSIRPRFPNSLNGILGKLDDGIGSKTTFHMELAKRQLRGIIATKLMTSLQLGLTEDPAAEAEVMGIIAGEVIDAVDYIVALSEGRNLVFDEGLSNSHLAYLGREIQEGRHSNSRFVSPTNFEANVFNYKMQEIEYFMSFLEVTKPGQDLTRF